MPKLKVNDIAMYYEVQGEGEPVVLVAGFSADNILWGALVNILKNNYQVIVLDNRGAGQTDAPAGAYSIDQMANDIVALCANIGIKQAHFIGNSMGGFIVQTLAYQNPELVKSVIISNSTTATHCCFNLYVQAQLELMKANSPRAALIKASCAWAFSFQFLTQPGVFESLIKMGLENPYPFSVTGYEGQYAALQQFDSSQWASQIHVPALVISANQDLIFSEQSVKSLAELIPNAAYFCFADCGHLPFVEYPEKFAKLVKEHIQQVA